MSSVTFPDGSTYEIVDAVARKNGGSGGGLVGTELTQAEYDELSSEEKNNGLYFITDGSLADDDNDDGEMETHHNAGSHNCRYRGKYLGNTVTSMQYDSIAIGSFENMYIGDYWTINGVNYRIAAFDYYMNCGVTPTTEHHVTLVPDTPLYTHCMNSGSDTTSGGYLGSEMYKSGLNQAKTIINTAFGETHVLKYGNRLPTSSPESSSSDVESTVELMNQINVYGSIINGSNTGSVFTYDNVQYPLFALNHSMITNGAKWWLRDGSDQHGFICTSIEGITNINGSRQANGVRPSFNIKG